MSFGYADEFLDGQLPAISLYPVFPTISSVVADDFVATRFIGGMDGDVILSKTLMSIDVYHSKYTHTYTLSPKTL